MDAYEATRVVFSRIQALDPDNAAKIMGLLLIQDHGNKEMIRLAFGPETLLHSVVLKARNDLGLLLPPSDPSPPPYLLSRQNSTPRLLSPSSWAPPPCFSRTNSANGNHGSGDELLNHDVRVSGGSSATTSPFYGGDLIDDHQLHDRLSFLNDPTAAAAQIGPKGGDLLYQDVPGECGSPSGNGDGVFYPYLTGWAANNHRRRSCSVADLCVGSDVAGSGWKPCVYFARGYCKNGSSCRFLHGHPDDSAVADAVVEHQCQELLLRSKSQRLSGGGAAQLMASAAALHYSLTGAALPSPSASTKCMDLLLQHQQQQNDIQRAAAATAALMMGGDEANKFMGRTRIERSDSAGMMMNPGSRQIYLTFPADSTFQEEDVSNYFSIYGPVQDVRIPYQLKRMFGFVTFVYSETVRLILAKGNPHFVCDSRVLVKPYKEKGKVPDKKQQQQGDFSPTGMDSRDPYDLQHLGARMMYSSTSSNQEMLLRRKLEQQHAIELQERRFMELQLGCLTTSTAAHINSTTAGSTPEQLSPEGNSPSTPAAASTALSFSQAADRILSSRSSHGFLHQAPVNAAAADKEESAGERSSHQDSDFHESFDHNLPDSPFASPTRASPPPTNSHRLFAATSTLDMASYNSCFFQMPSGLIRFSSGHGAVEM